MPNLIESKKPLQLKEEALGSSILYPFDYDVVADELDLEDNWNINNMITNPFKLNNQPLLPDNIEQSTASTWDAINAWLFDSSEDSSSDMKQESRSPYHTSSSSISSENETDSGLVSFQLPNQPFNPDTFLNQKIPTSNTDTPQEQVAPDNCIINSSSSSVQILNEAIHHISATLSEPQYRVYQKFIPIKPKQEKSDTMDEQTVMTTVDMISDSNLVSPNPIKMESAEENMSSKPTSKRRMDVENESMQRQSRKQKRMARNRESALQSRQKKKEMMQTLEMRLAALSNVNNHLKFENDVLKDKIKHLETENFELKSKKPLDVPDLAKKTSCVLVLFVFLAINMKPISSDLSSTPVDSSQAYSTPMRHGRYLLEDSKTADNQAVYQNIVYNREEAKRRSPEGLMDILDRNVIRKIKRLYRLHDKIKREQIAAVGHDSKKNKVNETNDDPDCSLSFNKTEVFRLNEALERLVKVHKKKARRTKTSMRHTEKTTKLNTLKNLLKHTSNCTDGNGRVSNCSKNSTTNNDISPRKLAGLKKSQNQVTKQNEIQTFQHDWSAFERFQKSINRQPNTFYFVSFRRDHILLPPLQLNETQRPRVSFILPNSNSTHSIWNSTGDKVSLMQIDCQVMDTKIFHISKQNIPLFNPPLSSFFLRQN